MHHGSTRRFNKRADFFESVGIQPSIPAAALDGEAVRLGFIRSAVLMPALVAINPKLYGCADASHQSRVEDQEARKSGTVVVEPRVKDRRPMATLHRHSVDDQVSRLNELTANSFGIAFRGRRLRN